MSAMMISCLVIGLVGVFVALLSIPFFTHEKTLRKNVRLHEITISYLMVIFCKNYN